VIASQPAKLHTSSAAAGAIASQPCGANGVRFDSRACGSVVTVATSSSVTRSPARPSCRRPDTRNPPRLAAVTMAISTNAVVVAVAWPPPSTSAVYAPANRAAAGAPTGTAK
jgi:hypothetical protein